MFSEIDFIPAGDETGVNYNKVLNPPGKGEEEFDDVTAG